MSRFSLSLGLPIVSWLLALVLGFAVLENYATTPGPASDPEAPLPLTGTGSPLLIMFAHPRCPCTQASLAALAEILARAPAEVRAEVWFVKPAEAAANWEHTSLCAAAAAIPGMHVRWDQNGAGARRLGATTSGHVFLFDGAGNLLFRGGITRARGQEGGSSGSRAIQALLNGEEAAYHATPVFGCALLAACAAPTEEKCQ
jgi:hypothetical protein